MMEAQLITAMVAQSFRLELAPGARVEPWPNITLRTRHGLMMILHPEVKP
jgi:cytochrome P450